jgi:hypothetical protein
MYIHRLQIIIGRIEVRLLMIYLLLVDAKFKLKPKGRLSLSLHQ